MTQNSPSNPASTDAAAKTRLAIGALGVVFGDIGTSPLYAFRESFIGTHRLPIDPLHVLGVLSLIVWALILVVYAARRTMPNGLVFPRDGCDLDMIGSA